MTPPPSERTPRRYYAAEHSPSEYTQDAETGWPIRTFVAFASAADRIAWIEDAPSDQIGAPGWREAVSTRDRWLRRALGTDALITYGSGPTSYQATRDARGSLEAWAAKLDGFGPPDHVVIAAATGAGKTTRMSAALRDLAQQRNG